MSPSAARTATRRWSQVVSGLARRLQDRPQRPMHLDEDQYSTFENLKRFTLKYTKVLKNFRRSAARPAHLVDEPPHAIDCYRV